MEKTPVLISTAIFLILGFLQITASMAGLSYMGIPTFFVILLSILLCGFPIIGTIIGIYGAMHVWGWSLFASVLLFIAPWLVIVILLIIANSEK